MTLTLEVRAAFNLHDAIMHAFGVAKTEVEGQRLLNEELFREGMDYIIYTVKSRYLEVDGTIFHKF